MTRVCVSCLLFCHLSIKMIIKIDENYFKVSTHNYNVVANSTQLQILSGHKPVIAKVGHNVGHQTSWWIPPRPWALSLPVAKTYIRREYG